MPIVIPEQALAPFYDTEVAFFGTRPGPRPIAVVVKCCVFEDGFAPPPIDTDVDTSVRTYSLSFPISAWTDETPPQKGERVSMNGADYFVDAVQTVIGDYNVTVKEGIA